MSKLMRCVFSPLTEFDLEEIGSYIARDNPRRAVSFIQEIREMCIKLTAMPEAFPLRPDLGASVRVAHLGRYLIIYTVDVEIIRIERIIGARNIPVLFDA